MQNALPSEVLLVLGMHRSGTSALTRSLNLLGLTAPKTLIKNNDSNVKGHWESLPLSQLNDEFLKLGDLSWSDWKLGSMDRIRSKDRRNFKQDLKALLESEFPAGRPCVLKEPRVCRIMDEYLEFFNTEELPVRAVIPVRNPLEVIQSLVARNSMKRLDAALLWLRNVLEAVHASKNLKRVFISYPNFVEKPVEQLSAVAEQLQYEYPVKPTVIADEIESFINSGLRHHTFEAVDVAHDPVTDVWINDAYLALLHLCGDPENEMALETLSKIKTALDSADPILQVITQAARQAERDLRGENAKSKQALETSETELHSSRQELTATYEKLQASENQLTASKNELNAKQEQLQAETQDLEASRSELKATYEKLQATDNEIGALRSELTSSSERLQTSDNELAALHDEIRSAYEKLQTSNDERDTYQGELKSTYDRLQSSNNQLDALRKELQSTQKRLDTSSSARTTAERKLRSATLNAENMFKTQEDRRRDMERLQLESGRLSDEIHKLRGIIEVLKNSTSWRLTAPVRGIAKIARRITPRR